MSATPMTQAVGAAPSPRSAVRCESNGVSPRGRGSHKIAPESAAWVERARPRPVGVAPSPRSTVRGASTVVSAWGQASVVVDDSSSVEHGCRRFSGFTTMASPLRGQPRPTPCGCSYTPPCRSGAPAAINRPWCINHCIAPRAGLPQTTLTVAKAIHSITPSPLRGCGRVAATQRGTHRRTLCGCEGWGLAATCPLAGLLECLVVPSEGERPPSIPLSKDHQNADLPHPHLNHSTKAWAPALMGK